MEIGDHFSLEKEGKKALVINSQGYFLTFSHSGVKKETQRMKWSF